MYPLFVVILNWNLPADTIACVESVLAGKTTPQKIILVDNNSTDQSVALFRQRFSGLAGEPVVILQNSENLGFAGGVNTGIREALNRGAQSILLLNNDTIVADSMISSLLSAAVDQPRAGILGPLIYYYDRPERVWRFADRQPRWPPLPVRMSDREITRSGGKPFQVDYITACGMLIRRAVIVQAGLFDERYFMYFEDADFCRRARQAGFEIWCAPQAKMWHKVSLSGQKQKPATRYAQSWGRVQYYLSYAHGLSRGIAIAYLLARSVVFSFKDILAGDWNLLKPSWQGTVDGLISRPAKLDRFWTSGKV